MSLYNLLFGVNQLAPVLLKILGIKKEEIERFRDCFISNGRIAVYTRTGGNNRETWPNKTLTTHKYFIHTYDDDYDETYATFYFTVPKEFQADLDAFENKEENYLPSENWKKLFEVMNSDAKKESQS